MSRKRIRVKRAPSRQQLSRLQRERRMQRWTLYIGAAVIGLIIFLLLFGFWDRQVRFFRKPAIKVNDNVIRTDYYIELLKLFKQTEDPVAKVNVADYTINFIQNNELVRQWANKSGIIVTPGEIQELLSKRKMPTNDDTARNLVIMDLYAQKARDNIASSIPTHATQAHVLSILVQGKEKAEEVRDKLRAGENFATLAKQFSLDFSSKDKGGDLGWVLRETVDKNFGDAAFTIEPGAISEPVNMEGTLNFWVLKVPEREYREMSAENRQALLTQAFNKWIVELKKGSQIEVFLNDKDKMKALEIAGKR